MSFCQIPATSMRTDLIQCIWGNCTIMSNSLGKPFFNTTTRHSMLKDIEKIIPEGDNKGYFQVGHI